MKRYKFVCEDDGNKVVVEFKTESDSWSGYDGPAYNFFLFLQGCGFTFGEDSDLGVVMNQHGKTVFMSSDENNGATEVSFNE